MDARQPFENLMEILMPVSARGYVCGLLDWDIETNCPPKAEAHRAYISGLMAADAHQAFIDPQVGRAIERALAVSDKLLPIEQRYLKLLQESYRGATCLPTSFVQAAEVASAESLQMWKQAKDSSDYSLWAPHLAKVLDFTRRKTFYLGAAQNDARSMYDVLLADYEPGFTTDRLIQVLTEVRRWLVPFIRRLDPTRSRPPIMDGIFDDELQRPICRRLLTAMGYDFSAGNLSASVHPFCATVGPDDHRITVERMSDSIMALYSAAHEGGHAMYAQGDPAWLAWAGPFNFSLGIDESQSRLWENMVGRDRSTCHYLYPQLAAAFPRFRGMTANDLYLGVNTVKPSLIRVDADEVTYNLHILVRVELEIELLSGQVSIADLPVAFADRYQAYLGLRPDNDAAGVLQDIHWADGSFGYFGTYTLGNLASAQLWNKFTHDHPVWTDEFSAGDFSQLFNWLQTNVYPVARTMDIDALMSQATGEPLNPQHWFDYIEKKYSQLYHL